MVVACGKMLEKYSLKIDEFLPRNRHCRKRILRVSNFEKPMAGKKPDVLLQYRDLLHVVAAAVGGRRYG
jgi:hypothetical protein